MSVMVGLIAREIARFSKCYASIIGAMPEGSEFILHEGYSTPQSWNVIARQFLKSKHEYLFTMNDDHIYPADTIPRLLAHKKQCVTGLYLLRQYPFEPVIYDYVSPDGKMGHKYLQPGETGLVQIKVCGDGALLTHRSVFETIPDPWYQLNGPPAPLDQINCDVLFCAKLREHGIEIWCDLDVKIGHIAVVPILPKYAGGVWSSYLSQNNGMGIEIPAAKPGDRPAMEAELARLVQMEAGK